MKHKLFLIEGRKLCEEALQSGQKLRAIVILAGKEVDFEPLWNGYEEQTYLTSSKEFQALNSQVQPEGIMMVLEIPPNIHYAQAEGMALEGPAILLENLQDPGNVGTILRTADWFGISRVYCSVGTVDVLNAKVLRSSMGAIFRVNIQYVVDFDPLIPPAKGHLWAADMGGNSLLEQKLSPDDLILLGNEANGISSETRQRNDISFMSIPQYGKTESLNVGIAAGILIWELAKTQ